MVSFYRISITDNQTMIKPLTPKHLWRGVLAISVAAAAVFVSALFNFDQINTFVSGNKVETARGQASTNSVPVTLDGNNGSRINGENTYTITATNLNPSSFYRLVLVVDGNAQPDWEDFSNTDNASHQVSYTFTQYKNHSVVGVVQACNQDFSSCSESPDGGRSRTINVSLCGCASYSGCGTSCNFNGFDTCMDEAQSRGIPMIQVCRPEGPVCEPASDWIGICNENLAPAGQCVTWKCNNQQCTPGSIPEKKPITVVTRCIAGTSPEPNPDRAGDVQITLVNLEPSALTTSHDDPASDSADVEITGNNTTYAVEERVEDNQGRSFTPVVNNLGCTISGSGFEHCPWTQLTSIGGTFVFEIDCSENPPPPNNEPPSCTSLIFNSYDSKGVPTSATATGQDPLNDGDEDTLSFKFELHGPSNWVSDTGNGAHTGGGNYTYTGNPTNYPTTAGTYYVQTFVKDSKTDWTTSEQLCKKPFTIEETPPPPEKKNPSCDSFNIYNTRTMENCSGTTCYAQPGDQLRLTSTGKAGDWAQSPNVSRYAYMSTSWQLIPGGSLERGDTAYGTQLPWTAPATAGNYLVATNVGWVGPLGDGNLANDDGRLCTSTAPDFYVFKPNGNDYINLPGQTCSFVPECMKSLVITQVPNENPEVIIQKTLISTRVVKVGENTTFRLAATNTGNTTLTQIPVKDEFETEYLNYATATIAPSRVDEHGNTGLGTIEWSNILATNEVLFPGQSKAWDVTFTATKTTDKAQDQDADNCMWIYKDMVHDDQGNIIPSEDLASCDYVIIQEDLPPVTPAVDIEKSLTTSGDIYIGDEVTFDLVVTNTGPIDLVEYDLIDTYDSSMLRYLRAAGDKKESTGEWSTANATVSFSAGGGHLVAEDLQNLFGVLNPNDQIYVHLVFEAAKAGTTTDTARINAKGENGEWVYDEDSASAVIISVKPPKTGASEVIGLGVFTLLGGGSIVKAVTFSRKRKFI